MKKILVLLFVTTLLLAGCNRKPNDESKEEKKAYNVELSEAQKKYLMNEQMISEDALKYMDREGINWNLLGTGLELYNPTSGVEVNGLKYKPAKGFDYKANSSGTKLITIEEATDFRKLDEDMRIEKLADYKYTITPNPDKENGYFLEAPVKGYDNFFFKIIFELNNDEVYMKYVVFSHIKGDQAQVFSVLYDRYLMDAYLENNSYTMENKLICGIQYTSVTDKSLVLSIWNNTEKDYEFAENCVINRIVDGKTTEFVCNGKCSVRNIDANTAATIAVAFDKTIMPGNYEIVFGTGEESEVSGRLSFDL